MHADWWVDLNTLFLGFQYGRAATEFLRNAKNRFDECIGCDRCGAGWPTAVPDLQAVYGSLLDYFFTDIAANYFPGRMSMSGPHSRDYDYPYDGGNMDSVHFLYMNPPGLNFSGRWGQSDDLQDAFMLHPILGATASFPGYAPPKRILQSAYADRKWVQTAWRQALWVHTFHGGRVNLVTGNYSIGTNPSSYRVPHNRLTSAEVARPKADGIGLQLPARDPFGGPAVLTDGTLSPTLFPTVSASFHGPGDPWDTHHHLYSNPTPAQVGNAALVSFAVDSPAEASATLTTSWTIPRFVQDGAVYSQVPYSSHYSVHNVSGWGSSGRASRATEHHAAHLGG